MWCLRLLRKIHIFRLFGSPLSKILLFALATFFYAHGCLAESAKQTSSSVPATSNTERTQASEAKLKVLNKKIMLALEGKTEIFVSAANADIEDVGVSVRNVRDDGGKPLPTEAIEAIQVTPTIKKVEKDKVKTVTVEIDKNGQRHFKEGKYTAEVLLEAANTNLLEEITLQVYKDQTVVVPSGTYERKKGERAETPTFVVVRAKLWRKKNTEEILRLVQIKGEVFNIGEVFAEPLIRSDGVFPKDMKIEIDKNGPNNPPRLNRGKEETLGFQIVGAKKVGEFTTTIHIRTPELTGGEISIPIKVIVKHHWVWLIGAMVPGIIATLFLTLKYIVPSPETPGTTIELAAEYIPVIEKMQGIVKVIELKDKERKKEISRFNSLVELVKYRIKCLKGTPGKLSLRGTMTKKHMLGILDMAPLFLHEQQEIQMFRYAIKELFWAQKARWGRFSFTVVTLTIASIITIMVGLYTLYYAEKPFGDIANYLQAGAYGFGVSLGPTFTSILPTIKTYIDKLLQPRTP